MRIPRYWAKTSGSATGPKGKRYRLELWGSSNESVADALAAAGRRLSEVTARLARGEISRKYLYGERALREEIVRSLGAPDTEAEAVVTRNRYGALVLNTARVPFIDVDAPETGLLGKLFAALARRKLETPEAVLERIRRACLRSGRHSFRIYRTKAGFRVLATDLLLDPTSERARNLLAAFGADPQFIRLCGVQQGFRARLTPKPWRCGCELPPGQHPREDAQLRERFAAWLERYEAACAGFATCRFLESVGRERQIPEVRVIVEEHDRSARVGSGLPLA